MTNILDREEFETALVAQYEFDLTMGNMSDHMGRGEFARLYNKRLADGWEPWGERELIIHQKEMRSGGILQVGMSAVVAQAWRRRVTPVQPVQ